MFLNKNIFLSVRTLIFSRNTHSVYKYKWHLLLKIILIGFQDLNETCSALNFLLSDSKNRITEFIEGSLVDVVFTKPNFLLYWLQEEKDISQELYTVLEQGFEIRHKVIHDANFIYKIEPHFINAFEDCMVIFPQLISILLAKKYNAKRPVYNVEKHYKPVN